MTIINSIIIYYLRYVQSLLFLFLFLKIRIQVRILFYYFVVYFYKAYICEAAPLFKRRLSVFYRFNSRARVVILLKGLFYVDFWMQHRG